MFLFSTKHSHWLDWLLTIVPLFFADDFSSQASGHVEEILSP
jgi:hypothetical protein